METANIPRCYPRPIAGIVLNFKSKNSYIATAAMAVN